MENLPRILLASLGLLTLVPTGAGHPASYVGWNDNANVSLPECPGHDAGVFVGIVCFRGGHIVPNAVGAATVAIIDVLVAPSSGFVCQDLDADHLCGELGQGEVALTFCGSGTLFTPTWKPQAPLLILLDGPVFGSALLTPCGTLYSGNTQGTVSHS